MTGKLERLSHSASDFSRSDVETMSSDEMAEAYPNKSEPYQVSNLTSNQFQVWIAQSLLPEAPIYNLAVALYLEDEIDPVHLGSAFRVLVNSSDALRTVIADVDGVPMQQVLLEAPSAIELLDFSQLSDSESAAKNWLARRCQRPLDLRRALYDSVLIKLPSKRSLWYLCAHHLICDGWSFELIYRRMSELYRASLEGRLPDSADLPAFADYVAYERAFRHTSRHQKAAAYWGEALANAGETVNFYGKLPLRATTRVRRISQELGVERTERLKAVAAAITGSSESAALFNVFAAALVGYLYCLNGRDAYTIGVPFHNRRSQSSFKQTIGFFSEVLPVRVSLADDETLASLSKKFAAEVRMALRHGQHSVTNPFFKRLYEVTLNYHVRTFSEFAGIPARPEWIHNGHGDESLGIQIRNFGSSSSLTVDFDLHEGIFDKQDGARARAHFLSVLDALLLDPNTPVRRLSLASRAEAARLLTAWAMPVAEQEARAQVHRLFEERARRQPDGVAVVQAGERLTYDDLNHRANSLARLLRDHGVAPRTTVGIYLNRSRDIIVAMLGVLKAGAAYVPIDPQYSSEWLKFILEDTRAPVLLTQRNLLDSLSDLGAEAICLDDPAELDSPDAEEIEVSVESDDLAYIVYTSGSTGTPKGVEITHRALANFTAEAARIFELTSSDRVLQFASISFDTSVEEIFPCLTRGATLVLRADSPVDSTTVFLERCREWGITVLDLPTAYWHEMTTTLYGEERALPDSVRLVIIGGERAIPEKLALWQACVGDGVRLLNTYGPTEATVVSTVYDLTHASVECGVDAEIPIGRPITNVQTIVLDQNLCPVPEGVPGELYIGGIGLARGYLRRPDLTAEKFIPNPFDAGSGFRLYKTGDIVRHREDGNIEYLRRSDEQVKVRGFRVELEGVASVLRQHPLIRDAAVLAEPASRSGRLVAYVVPEAGGVLNLTEVQTFVRSRLPDYMVPAALVRLESLPLSPRGKLDRRALPLPDNPESERQENLVPPQSLTEQRLASIWCELLSLRMIGRDQHFFEIGGHSLLAAQVISRVRREWRADLPLRAIFEAPTIASLAERIEEAPQENPAPAQLISIPANSHNGQAPASDSQSRIWYMDQFAPESSAYNITAPVRFTGALDRRALQQSVQELTKRHQSLRTTIRSINGRPVQLIGSAAELELQEIDLTSFPEEARVEEAKRILREEGRRPFNLDTGPLLRLFLLQLHDDDHVLLLTMHHVISDQWSLNVIAREVSSLYNGFRNGASPALDPVAAQYGDFAVWEDRQLTPDRMQAELGYWQQRLAGMQASAFPSDRPRPPMQTFRGAHQSVSLPTSLIDQLRKLAVKENATLYMVFLALFKILLSRYSGREDVAIGSPVANRNRSEWEGIIGTFINVLVLRTDLSGNPSLRQIIGRVRETVLDGFTHQEMPFQKLVQELVPDRDSSRTPLVQVLFNFQSTPVGKISFDGMSWAPFEIDQWAAQFDVNVTIDPEITRKVFLTFNTDLYDAETISRILDHYVRLLEAAAADADQSFAMVSRLLVNEQERSAAEGDEDKISIPDACIHELFEAQTRNTPNAIAVVFGDQQLSYRELNERSNQLARRLRAAGVGAENLVGIVIERSPELVIGIFGILKAGAAYVPIDPAYPPERIAFICQDSGVTALLTQQALLARLPTKDLSILCFDGPDEVVSQQPLRTLHAPGSPQQLAYVIYTSGSTGKPKGVEISHRALVNFLYSMKQRPGLDASDILLSVTTISFDIAALELFLPLITGARVVIACREVAADGKRLMEQLAACGATVMQATPTTWRMMIEAGWEPERQFKIICGGEALPLDLAQALIYRSDLIWNLYGPTETTVWSTIWPVESNAQRICIGRPIHNTKIHILDSGGLPVPVGVPGEIYIGGEGLARGYFNRPELTAEKFVPNPFGAPSSRLYRSGDLGRCLTDGNIEFIGRIDNQVKVRGFRIELGEIEAVLAGHEEVREAVVVMREEESDKRLVGYVVRQAGGAVTEGDLVSYAKRKLPNYMVPSAFVFLDSLPLTPNGKIDRQALPTPSRDEQSTADFAAPLTAIEEIIEGVWQEVLKRTRVSVQENFFDLGGHSLLATQVISRLRDAFQIDLPLRAIFETPTIAGLAVVVENGLRGEAGVRLPPMIKRSADEIKSVSFAQERLWVLNQLQPENAAYNISLAIQVTGALDVTVLERTLNEIVGRHEILRASFPAREGNPVEAVSGPGLIAVSVVDLTTMPVSERDDQTRRLAVEFIQRPFDLARGPLLRVALLRLDDANQVLVFVVHHIVFDARSAEIFLKELIDGYQAAATGEASQRPELTFQYGDYAAWQRAALQGEFIERQIAYWKRQLKGSPLLLKLPTDRSRPPVKGFHGSRYSWTISAPQAEALRELSRGQNVTLFMTLFAAFNVLLHRYSTQEDIVVGTPISNRATVETEAMIGLFINTLALRTNIGGNPSFRELLHRVRETALGAYTHQDLPFEELLKHAGLERNLAYTPLFQVMFMFQAKPAPLTITGLRVEPMDIESGTAKFDLTLAAMEIDNYIHAGFEYDTDLFERDTIERMAGHFQNLLQSIIADPDQRVADLALLNETERDQIIQWSSGQCERPVEACLHRLFEAQVKRTPDALAVVCREETLSYRQLNGKANQLARRLSKLGIGPEALVGICMERSPELMVALLATLKAGGAYVPLDPDLPRERLDFMLRDSGCAVLITQSRLLEKIPSVGAEIILCVDTAAAIETEPVDNLNVAVTPDDSVYCIYTSGSTGTPKGVVLPHRALVNYLNWAVGAYAVNEGEGAPVFSSISFDLSVTALFAPLLAGKEVELTSDAFGWDAVASILSQRRKYSFVKITPAHLELLARQVFTEDAGASARRLIIGGENLTADHLRYWREAAGDAVIFNEYGPTETAVGCCVYQLVKGKHEAGSIPIGKAITNTQIYILDSQMQPVPVGVPGEIYIGGEGLARGYFNRPELTAEKFVPNPFGAPSSRLYRSGDLGRCLTDGNIEFIGRIDNQVKVRGFRIELGEIEAVLTGHEEVREAMVVMREEESDKRLVGYVVRQAGGAVTEGDLVSYAKRKLPNYMVPSAFVFLDSLPLTPNGKIDRQALPSTKSDFPIDYEPGGRLEFELVRLWKKYLHIDNFGLRDSFFELGGDSLRAATLIARVEKHFGCKIRLIDFFAAPTVEGLATLLSNSGFSPRWTSLVPIQPHGSKPPFFWVHGDGSNVILPAYLGEDQPIYGFMHQSQDGEPARYTTVEAIAAHYLDELNSVQPEGPYFLGGYSFGGLVAFEMAQQIRRRGEQVCFLPMLEPTCFEIASEIAEAGMSRSPRKEELWKELHRHLNSLRSVGILERYNYVMIRMNDMLKKLVHFESLTRACKRVAYRCCQFTGRRLPVTLRSTYILDVYTKAARAYKPAGYPGPALLISTLSDRPEYVSKWRELIDGELMIVPVSGDHMNVLQEPILGEWAERIKTCLIDRKLRDRA